MTIDRSGDRPIYQCGPHYYGHHPSTWVPVPGAEPFVWIELRARPVATDDALLALLKEARPYVVSQIRYVERVGVGDTAHSADLLSRIDAFLGAPLMPLDLDAIRKREQAATPGPWSEGGPYPGASVLANEQRGLDGEPGECDVVCVLDMRTAGPPPDALTLADRAFIAHARTDVPALLAANEALEKRVKELEDAPVVPVERLNFWRGRYIALVEAIMVESRSRPTLRMFDVEARLRADEDLIVQDARAALSRATTGGEK